MGELEPYARKPLCNACATGYSLAEPETYCFSSSLQSFPPTTLTSAPESMRN